MTEEQSKRFPWRLFWVLFAAGALGVLGATPLLLTFLGDLPQQVQAEVPLPFPLLLLISYLQNAVLLALAVGVGLLSARRLDLGAPLLERWIRGKEVRGHLWTILQPSLIAGIGVGVALLLLLRFVFLPLIPNQPFTMAADVAIWKRVLVCFYGGFTEEILVRLFLFSVLAWLISKVWYKQAGRPPLWVLWTVNIIVAIIFGLGHLPSASLMMPITVAVVTEALLLNGIASITFGYLYWSRGLEAAMIAHFSADFVLYVIGPIFIRG
jgi:hypothetical protein